MSGPRSTGPELPDAAPQQAEPRLAAASFNTRVTRLAAADWFDFTHLSSATVQRRVEGRMRERSVRSVSEYLSLLQRSADEVATLRTELMANGTAFFRDPDVWSFLERRIIPRLLSRARPSRPLRVWIPHCGAGAEAYTMAMLLAEQMNDAQRATEVQLFASEPDDRAMQTARAGEIPRIAGMAIGPGRLARFFVESRHGYRVTKELRQMVVFARHDLLCDLPFLHMDLVCCRYLLTHLRPPARAEVARILHRSLDDGGHLILGRGEHVGHAVGLFEPVSRRWCVFRRSDGGRHEPGISSSGAGTPGPGFASAIPNTLATTNGNRANVARMLRLMNMGKLAASLAHELSQPLSALANILEACATHLRTGGATSEELLDLTNEASSQSHRAGRIVAHMSRLLHDGERLVERCELRTLVRTAAELLRPTLVEHGIELQLVLGDVPLWGDLCRIEIEQVLVNLLQNAADAIVDGGGDHRLILVEMSESSNEHVTVGITDTGSGIPAGIATRLFEPFFTTKADGFGMGLAICRSIVDAHDGRLWIDREPDGDATRMCFSLPLSNHP